MKPNTVSSPRSVSKQRPLNLFVAAGMSVFAALLLSACSSTAQVRQQQYTAKPQFSRAYVSPQEVDKLPSAIHSDDKKTSALLLAAAGDLSGYHVRTDFLIDEQGVPFDIQCVAAPTEALARAAETAISEWRFKPAMKSGKPVVIRSSAGFIASAGNRFATPTFLYPSTGQMPRQSLMGM